MTSLAASKDLVQEIHVLVSPDKRTSRGLKEVRRRQSAESPAKRATRACFNPDASPPFAPAPLRTRAEEIGLPVAVLPEGGIKAFTVRAHCDPSSSLRANPADSRRLSLLRHSTHTPQRTCSSRPLSVTSSRHVYSTSSRRSAPSTSILPCCRSIEEQRRYNGA